MRVWLVCFFAIFALAELFNWVQKFSLPLPIHILGGVLLAVASNHDKIFGFSTREILPPPSTPLEQLPHSIESELPSDR